MTSVLTSTLAHGITLSAAGAYTAPFTIAQTGVLNGGVYSNLAGISSPFLENLGFDEGVLFANGGTVQNAGTISNAGLGYGVLMRAGGGSVTNAQNAVIYSGNYGVAILGGPGLITNAGSIGGLAGAGAEIASGTITNLSGGYIYAHNFGVKMLNADSDLRNAGTIAAHQYGVFMNGGDAENTGTITGQLGALFDSAASATIVNSGTLAQENSPFGTGVKLFGGTLINTGFIYGGTGLYLANAGTVFNAGTIAAGFRYAIDFAGDGANRLIAAPGAAFLGGVIANTAATNVLELTAGQSTLSGIGERFTGFATIAFDAGAAWELTGQVSAFAGDTISGFTTADTLDLSSLSVATAADLTLSPSGVLALPDGISITFSATNAGETFALTPNGHGGVLLTEFTGTVSNTTSTYGNPVTVGGSSGQTTISGPVDTVGIAGTYTIQTGGGYTTTTIGAGVIDNGGTSATVTNTSTVQSDSNSPYDAGIILTGASTLINAGTVIAASGISVMGTAAGAYIVSTKDIDATLGTGIYLQQSGSGLNEGDITAATTGILLARGGYGYNSGNITAATGISAAGANSYVYNCGQIIASSDGIVLPAAGMAINAGTIRAGGTGIYGNGGTAYNYGAITAATGILLTGAGAYAYNTGKITSTADGIYLTAAGIVSNVGDIQSSTNGVALGDGGVAYNYGAISAATGIAVAGGGTVYEFGRISGTNFAVYFSPGVPNRLVINSSSRLEGEVSGGGGVLELAAGAIGTVALGTFENFGVIQIDPRAKWNFAGPFSTAATLDNNGVVKLAKTAPADFAGAVTGKGTIVLSTGPTTFAGAVAATQQVDFSGAGQTLTLAAPAGFAGAIGRFTGADTIDITGLSLSDVTATAFAGGVLTIEDLSGGFHLTFANTSRLSGSDFRLTEDGTGVLITLENPARQKASVSPIVTQSAVPGVLSTSFTPTSAALPLVTLQA